MASRNQLDFVTAIRARRAEPGGAEQGGASRGASVASRGKDERDMIARGESAKLLQAGNVLECTDGKHCCVAPYCCGSAHGANTKSHTSAMWSEGQDGEGRAQVSDCSGGGCRQAGRGAGCEAWWAVVWCGGQRSREGAPPTSAGRRQQGKRAPELPFRPGLTSSTRSGESCQPAPLAADGLYQM